MAKNDDKEKAAAEAAKAEAEAAEAAKAEAAAAEAAKKKPREVTKSKPAQRDDGQRFSQRVSAEEAKEARNAKVPVLKVGDELKSLRANPIKVRGVDIEPGATYTISQSDAKDELLMAKFAAACRPGGMLAKV